MTEIEQETKKFKLPPQVREYHKLKERQKRGWKCARCGDPNPKFRTLDTKEKICASCTIIELKKEIK